MVASTRRPRHHGVRATLHEPEFDVARKTANPTERPGWPVYAGGSHTGACHTFYRSDRSVYVHVNVFATSFSRGSDWSEYGQIDTRYDCCYEFNISERFSQSFVTDDRCIRGMDWCRYTGCANVAYASNPIMNSSANVAVVFTASSSADFGLEKIFLTEDRLSHIMTGHRDLASVPFLSIKTAIENVTYVYNSHINHRLLFVSSSVTKGSRAYPLMVVVERSDHSGEIITASWKGNITGSVLWDSTNGLYTNFDEKADILYISQGPAIASYASEDEKDRDVWYRYSIDDDLPTGVTIFRAKARKGAAEGARIAAAFLGISEAQIQERLSAVL